VVQKVFFGPLDNPKNRGLNDITPREILALSPLIIMIFVIGWFPRLLLDPMEASVLAFTAQFRRGYLEASDSPGDSGARKMPDGVFHEGFLVGAPNRPPPKTEEPAPAEAVPTEAPSAAPVRLNPLDPNLRRARPPGSEAPPRMLAPGQAPGGAGDAPMPPRERQPRGAP
jgi:NADH-quinone oxidoreductase subunit M